MRRRYSVEHGGFAAFRRGCRNRRVSRDNDAGWAGSVRWLLRGRVLANAMGLPFRTSARMGAAPLAIFGADAGLRHKPDSLSLGADRALCHSVFHTHHGTDFALGGL